MFKEQMNKFISKFREKKQDIDNNNNITNKKKIENIVVFIIILIVTIVIINMIWNESKSGNNQNVKNTDKTLAKLDNEEFNTSNDNNINNNEDELEQKLKVILSKIEGVGNVDVLITYSQSSQIVTVYDEDTTQSITEESDTRWRK